MTDVQMERLSVALRSVAQVLREHENLRLRIEGHTDTDEAFSPKLAEHLSRARAETACGFLAKQGVDRKRLESVGRGCDCALIQGSSPQNRRIEFHILS